MLSFEVKSLAFAGSFYSVQIMIEKPQGFHAYVLLITVRAIITQKPSSITVEEGQNVSLLCKATGQPTPTITWGRAFSHVPKERTAMVDGNLTIFNLTKRDGGVELLSGRCCLITLSVSRLATIPENVSAGSFGAYVFG